MNISNPARWFYAPDLDSEWWGGGFETREEAVTAGRELAEGKEFCIAKSIRMVPGLDIFDGDDVCERIAEDECWWEDGWLGASGEEGKRELERRLKATLEQWFIEFGSLDGAALHQLEAEVLK